MPGSESWVLQPVAYATINNVMWALIALYDGMYKTLVAGSLKSNWRPDELKKKYITGIYVLLNCFFDLFDYKYMK